MDTRNILVIGSSNTDMVIKTDRLPKAGETVLGGTFYMNQGGKGANQAVAAARLGGNVKLIAKTGDDIFGLQAIEGFVAAGIDISLVLKDSLNPSGIAMILVDAEGENNIVVAPGANAALFPGDIARAEEAIMQAGIILMQLEIPEETVEFVTGLERPGYSLLILNPAPAIPLDKKLLSRIDIITPNQKEAEYLTGITVKDIESAKIAASVLLLEGVKTVIITLGAKGALLAVPERMLHIKSYPVETVDTTGAGDVFNGALAVALITGKTMEDAVRFACKAAAISVTRLGAQGSSPTLDEVLNLPDQK